MNLPFPRLRAALAARLMASFRRRALAFSPEDFSNLRFSFSQFGEDLVVLEALQNHRRASGGIYIDAGCFDPWRYSNTRLLHLHGWSGINIDGTQSVIDRFQHARPGDENICAVLSSKVEEAAFGGASNQAGQRLVRSSDAGASPLIQTRTLQSVYDSSRFAGFPVDLLDIDCEGFDLEVLSGLDLAAVRPFIICIEAHTPGEQETVAAYLQKHGYQSLADRLPTRIFIDVSQFPKNLPNS